VSAFPLWRGLGGGYKGGYDRLQKGAGGMLKKVIKESGRGYKKEC